MQAGAQLVTAAVYKRLPNSIEGRLSTNGIHARFVITRFVCGSEIWGLYTPARRAVWLQIPWTTEMDLSSLQLQPDCAVSVTECGGGMRFHAFLLPWPWPWPWPDDLDIRTWPEDAERAPVYQNELASSKSITADRQTDRQTQTTDSCDRTHYDAAFASGKNIWY